MIKGGGHMKRITRKTIAIMLTVILILSIFSFVGCAPVESYEVDFIFEALTNPVMYETLTKDSPSYEAYCGELRFYATSICPAIRVQKVKINSKEPVKTIRLYGKYKNEVDYSVKYVVIDSSGNQIESSVTQVDMSLTAERIEYGFRNLTKLVGEHCLEYTINSVDGYEIEPITFSIKLAFSGPSATKHMKYALSTDSTATLIMTAEQTKTYDVYKVYTMPEFYAYDVESNIQLPWRVHVTCKKLSENYYWDQAGPNFYGNGIYLCEAYCSEFTYYPNTYRFYAIYVGD